MWTFAAVRIAPRLCQLPRHIDIHGVIDARHFAPRNAEILGQVVEDKVSHTDYLVRPRVQLPI